MAKLSDEMKTMFERQLAVVATASSDGTPNVAPKGSMYVVDDQTLAYSEGAGQKTLRNLLQNTKVAVMVVDRDVSDGYQCKGTAEMLTTGDLYEQQAKRSESRGRPRPTHVVSIKIEEIYSVKAGLTAKKIA
jgi:predicted pyridoxine 5'-phosphate oxidase superfamily flavin-nucleotide-binding protein